VFDRTQTFPDPETEQSVRTRVFLSYSRKDGPFTSHLANELIERGYEPDFDQSSFDPSNIESGISAQDEWWPRLQQMIAAADVIVFIVSPDSAASRVCDEEIAYARNLGKRIIPVLCRSIDFAIAPPRLGALNVKISFIGNDGATFGTALDRLCADLDIDVGWHRESSRLIQLAVKWRTEGRSPDRLMGSVDIRSGERILQNRPRNADPPARLLIDFVGASRAAQKDRLRKEEEQIARAHRSREKAKRTSNKLVGRAEHLHAKEGVPVADIDEMLEDAVDLVDGLYEEGISDPRAERNLGLALAQLSEKKRLLNDFDQARRAAERAVQIFERLSKTDSENDQYLEDLHAALDRLIDASDDPEIALCAANRALGLARTLVGKNPTQDGRSRCSISLSKCAYLIKSFDPARAIAMFTEGLKIQEDILRHDDSLEYVRRAVALTHLNIGQLHSELAERSIAKTSILASLTEIGRLKTDYPRTITYVQDEAAARETLGDILKHEANIDGALSEYRESLALTERLSNIDRSNIELRLALMRAYDRVANAIAYLGHGDEAIEIYAKGLRAALELGRISPERNDWPGTRSLLDSLVMALIKERKPDIAYKYVNEAVKLLRDLATKNGKFDDNLAKVLSFQSYVAQFTAQFQIVLNASAEAVALSPKSWQIGVNRMHALLRAGDGSGAYRYYGTIREYDSEGGRKIVTGLEKDLDEFRSARLPEDFLLALDNLVKLLRKAF
jgi:tetratricopeptide (TPR) repeat protein